MYQAAAPPAHKYKIKRREKIKLNEFLVHKYKRIRLLISSAFNVKSENLKSFVD
jgi:hypothetical protein